MMLMVMMVANVYSFINMIIIIGTVVIAAAAAAQCAMLSAGRTGEYPQLITTCSNDSNYKTRRLIEIKTLDRSSLASNSTSGLYPPMNRMSRMSKMSKMSRMSRMSRMDGMKQQQNITYQWDTGLRPSYTSHRHVQLFGVAGILEICPSCPVKKANETKQFVPLSVSLFICLSSSISCLSSKLAGN